MSGGRCKQRPYEFEMKTILVSGSDTGIGKTWAVGALAASLAERGDSVQIVKPVESGYTSFEDSDAEKAKSVANSENVSAYTLRKFELAIAPVAAASNENESMSIDVLSTRGR